MHVVCCFMLLLFHHVLRAFFVTFLLLCFHPQIFLGIFLIHFPFFCFSFFFLSSVEKQRKYANDGETRRASDAAAETQQTDRTKRSDRSIDRSNFAFTALNTTETKPCYPTPLHAPYPVWEQEGPCPTLLALRCTRPRMPGRSLARPDPSILILM